MPVRSMGQVSDLPAGQLASVIQCIDIGLITLEMTPSSLSFRKPLSATRHMVLASCLRFYGVGVTRGTISVCTGFIVI